MLKLDHLAAGYGPAQLPARRPEAGGCRRHQVFLHREGRKYLPPLRTRGGLGRSVGQADQRPAVEYRAARARGAPSGPDGGGLPMPRLPAEEGDDLARVDRKAHVEQHLRGA